MSRWKIFSSKIYSKKFGLKIRVKNSGKNRAQNSGKNRAQNSGKKSSAKFLRWNRHSLYYYLVYYYSLIRLLACKNSEVVHVFYPAGLRTAIAPVADKPAIPYQRAISSASSSSLRVTRRTRSFCVAKTESSFGMSFSYLANQD